MTKKALLQTLSGLPNYIIHGGDTRELRPPAAHLSSAYEHRLPVSAAILLPHPLAARKLLAVLLFYWFLRERTPLATPPPAHKPSCGLPNSRFPQAGRTRARPTRAAPLWWWAGGVACDGQPSRPSPLPPPSLEAPSPAARPAPTAELAAVWDPMGGPGGWRADPPPQSPLFEKWRLRERGAGWTGVCAGAGAPRLWSRLHPILSAPRSSLHRVCSAGAGR